MSVAILGEISLPSNPNCICYCAPAPRALAWPWLKLQRVAWDGLERFHSASGIDAVAWFGRRVSLNRRNEASTQLTLNYVFDGPASREQVALFDTAAGESPIRWSASSVEPLSRHAFPSLCVKSGKFYQLWSQTPDGPRTTHMVMDGSQVSLVHRAPEEVGMNDFIPYVKHVVASRPVLRESDRRLEAQKVAFALRFSQRIVEADGVVHEDEARFIEKVFPADMLSRMGLQTPELLEEAWQSAKQDLPVQLGHHEKLALIGLFFAACHSDGTLGATEMKVLKEAADALGVPREDVVDYLRRIW